MSAEINADSSKPEIPQEFLDQAAIDTALPATHVAVSLLAAERRKSADLWSQIEILKLDLDRAEHDALTGFLLRGPGFRKGDDLLREVENNLSGLTETDEDSPTAVLVLGLDLEGLHDTNNTEGHEAGDKRIIMAADDIQLSFAQVVKGITRTRDRRKAADNVRAVVERRHQDDPERRTDILIRVGGDEFFAMLPFHETDELTKETMELMITERLEEQLKDDPLRARVLRKIAFFETGVHHSTEELWTNGADPKAGRSEEH